MWDIESKLNEFEALVGTGGSTHGLSNLQRVQLLEMMHFCENNAWQDIPEHWQPRLEALEREIILARQSQTLDSGPIVPLAIDLHS